MDDRTCRVQNALSHKTFCYGREFDDTVKVGC